MATRSTCTIQDCLATFSEEEVLDGDERYHCPRCKQPQRAAKCLRIYRFPEILMLHIKRFTQTKTGRDKLTTEVLYPEIIEDLQQVESGLDGRDRAQRYQLIGVCTHSGGLGGGHYVAHCKSIEDNQWYLFNDSHASASTPQGHSAYILFYQRLR